MQFCIFLLVFYLRFIFALIFLIFYLCGLALYYLDAVLCYNKGIIVDK